MATDIMHTLRNENDGGIPCAPAGGVDTPGEAFIRELYGIIKELNNLKKEEEKI
jgi:hypothetical protein